MAWLFTIVNCTSMPYPPTYISFLSAGIAIFLSPFTIIGNLLVVLAVLLNPLGNMRNPFNYFVVNLAVADLIVGTLAEPSSIVIHIREGLGLSLNTYVSHLSFLIASTASVLSIASLTAERYIAITSPMKYRFLLSTNRSLFASFIIWFVSITLSLVIYFGYGFMQYLFVFVNTSVISTLFVYLFVYFRLLQHFRTKIVDISTIQDTSEREAEKARIVALKWERKVTKTFLIMLALFLMSYTPACIMIYMMNICTSCSCLTIHWLRDCQFWFVILNSTVNPFVYALRLDTFRKSFEYIIKCKKATNNRIVPVRSSGATTSTAA